MEGSDKAVFVRNQHRGKAAAATHGDEGQASEREARGCLQVSEGKVSRDGARRCQAIGQEAKGSNCCKEVLPKHEEEPLCCVSDYTLE